MAESIGAGPFDEGLDAFGRGLKRSDCPYPEGSDEREEWEEGWDQGNDLNEEGEPREDI
jgi:ribosome modulation factor